MEDFNREIKISGIIEESIVDGPGIRLVVFVQGCSHRCKGCHNQHTQDFNGGENIKIDSIIKKVKENPLLDGVTLSGGEPFQQSETVSLLAGQLKQLNYNIITYSGYTYEEIEEIAFENPSYRELLLNTDILIDGKFEKDKKNLELNFRGSENQRIIDVAASMRDKKIKTIEL